MRQFRRRIHRYVVIGVSPCYAEDAAGAGGGAAVARHLLERADVRALAYVPGTGQTGLVGSLGLHGNGGRCAHSQDAAGIAVREAPSGIAATCVNLQVFQLGSVVAASTLGRNLANVVARGLSIAEGNGHADANRGIAQLAVTAGIVLGQKGQVGGRFFYGFGRYIPVFVSCRYGFLYRLIGLISHVDGGFRIGDSLGLVGASVRQGHADGPGIGVGHFLARRLVRVAHDGLGHHIVRVKGIAVVYRHLGFQVVVLAPGDGVALVDCYARQAHRDTAGFRVDFRSVDGLHGDEVRREGITAVVNPDSGVAIVPAFGHVHRPDLSACAHAASLGLYPAGAFNL